ncbi:MAG: hypothetical protein SVV03_04380 [Candidatus Nanohaloarchaea archaeon]|nr:hypothetical protein [Candidatus Nanohaloarchaea archaeon]
MRFSFPEGLRPPTVEQREKFYKDEFDLQNVKNLYYKWSHPTFAIDIGTESTRYKPRFKKYKGKLVFIRRYEDLEELKSKFERYSPEDLYYDHRVYRDTDEKPGPEDMKASQLVFDLDPELIDCNSCRLTRKHMKDDDAASYTFCEGCFEETAENTAEMRAFLSKHFNSLNVYFSGRGFHIHVRDEKGFQMSVNDKRELGRKLAKRFPVDKKITAVEKGLLRLPGSLHGLTGRKVIKVSMNDLKEPLEILYDKSEPESF